MAASLVWCVNIFRAGPFAVVSAWSGLKSCWKQRCFALKRSALRCMPLRFCETSSAEKRTGGGGGTPLVRLRIQRRPHQIGRSLETGRSLDPINPSSRNEVYSDFLKTGGVSRQQPRNRAGGGSLAHLSARKQRDGAAFRASAVSARETY